MADNEKTSTSDISKKGDRSDLDSYHAKRRRMRRDKAQERRDKAMGIKNHGAERSRVQRPKITGNFEHGPCIYGLHTVRAALQNPDRQLRGLMVTQNALQRLTDGFDGEVGANLDALPAAPDVVEPSKLDKLVGSDADHQGCVLLVEPVEPKPFSALAEHRTILALDQVTDPHNVGAIMRSAVALGCGALLTTSRYSAAQTGALAKSASGGLDMIDFEEATNLAGAIEELHAMGFQSLGLDSEGVKDFSDSLTDFQSDQPLLIIMGAEGKGLRQRTRETVGTLARLDMPGPIKSLNVSNAAALALFCVHRHRLG